MSTCLDKMREYIMHLCITDLSIKIKSTDDYHLTKSQITLKRRIMEKYLARRLFTRFYGSMDLIQIECMK